MVFGASLLLTLCASHAEGNVFSDLPDPLVAHAFLAATYHKQLHLAPPVTRVPSPFEALRLPQSDASVLVSQAVRTPNGEHLAFVGLRNLLAAAAASRCMSEADRDVAFGVGLSSGIIVDLMAQLKNAAFAHFLAAMESVGELSYATQDQIVVRKGLLELHAFIADVLGVGARFRELEDPSVFLNLVEQLAGVLRSLGVPTLHKIADPLGSVVVRLFRVVKKAESVSGSRPRPSMTFDITAVKAFLTSDIYADLVKPGTWMRSIAENWKDVPGDEDWLERFFDLHIYEDLIDLVEMDDVVDIPEDVRMALSASLTNADLLFDSRECSLTLNARALLDMQTAVALALNYAAENKNSDFLIDALRAEFYRMAVVFSGRMTDQLPERLRKHDCFKSLPSVTKKFFSNFIGLLSASTQDLSWILLGNKDMERLRILLVVIYTRAVDAVSEDAELSEALIDRVDAFSSLKHLFHRSRRAV